MVRVTPAWLSRPPRQTGEVGGVGSLGCCTHSGAVRGTRCPRWRRSHPSWLESLPGAGVVTGKAEELRSHTALPALWDSWQGGRGRSQEAGKELQVQQERHSPEEGRGAGTQTDQGSQEVQEGGRAVHVGGWEGGSRPSCSCGS